MKYLQKRLSKIKKFRIGFFSTLLLLSFFLSDPIFASASLVSIILHEFGHILAAKIKGLYFSEFTLSIFGAGLRPDSSIFSYEDEIFICAFGPFINFITFSPAFLAFLIFDNIFFLYVSLSSLILGLLNLLPIKDMDGGRILHSILCLCIPFEKAEQTVRIISFVSIIILWCFSVYLLMVTGSGLSSFIFSLSLFSKIFLSDSIK